MFYPLHGVTAGKREQMQQKQSSKSQNSQDTVQVTHCLCHNWSTDYVKYAVIMPLSPCVWRMVHGVLINLLTKQNEQHQGMILYALCAYQSMGIFLVTSTAQGGGTWICTVTEVEHTEDIIYI